MIVRELLNGTKYVFFSGDENIEISSLTYDSRKVAENSCFFAVKGVQSDGHAFIDIAIEKGARLIICQELPLTLKDGVSYAVVEDTNIAMATIASSFYSNPSRKLKVVGVTGTNGKTTIATLLYNLVRRMGYKAGLISTIVYKVNDKEIPSTHTTPDSIRLNEMMNQMVLEGCQYCFMECSSHAIVQNRILGIDFDGALFTNLTHDHLDYHKTFAEYIRAKKIFFDNLSSHAFALVNRDDKNGEVMLQNTRAHKYTLSLRSLADFNCKIVETDFDGMCLNIDGQEMWIRMLGKFNAYNLLTIYGAAVLLGFERTEVLRVLSTLTAVSGRFEMIQAKDKTTAIVDYAHTPDALENVIQTINEIRKSPQRLIVVCGCGGDRDKTKRPEMAAIAVKYADTAIFTSDNPRTEDPEQILRDMEAGVEAGQRYLKITDRKEAIRTAILIAQPKDIILVAGKGHEDYQIIGQTKHHFDDRECCREFFETFRDRYDLFTF